MTIKKRKGIIALTVILVVITIASLLIATLPVYIDSIYDSNSNTVEHSATVKNVKSIDKGFEIEVDEYSCTLVFSKEEVIDEKSLLELSVGDVITFNVLEFIDESFTNNDIPSLWIVSLKTNNTDIVTYESHCKKEEEDYKKVQITAAVFSAIFLVSGVICIVALVKDKKKQLGV